MVVQTWNGTHRTYNLRLESDTTVVEPTMFFSGWETEIMENGKSEMAKYILTETTQGRIAYRLAPGVYEVETRFTQNTLPRILGNSLFIVGLLACSAIYVKGRKMQS